MTRDDNIENVPLMQLFVSYLYLNLGVQTRMLPYLDIRNVVLI